MALQTNFLGAVNIFQVSNPELDELLTATSTTIDPEARQEAVNAAVKYIIDQAYLAPMYSQKQFIAINTRLKNYVYSSNTTELWLNNAYLSE